MSSSTTATMRHTGAAWLVTFAAAILALAIAGAAACTSASVGSLPGCPSQYGPEESGQSCVWHVSPSDDAADLGYALVVYMTPCPSGQDDMWTRGPRTLCVDSVTGIEYGPNGPVRAHYDPETGRFLGAW